MRWEKQKIKTKPRGVSSSLLFFCYFTTLSANSFHKNKKISWKQKPWRCPNRNEKCIIFALLSSILIWTTYVYTATYRRYMHPKYCPYPSVIFVCFWQVRGCQNTNHITAEQGQGQLVRTIYIRILYSVRSMSNQHLDFGQWRQRIWWGT